MWNWLSTYGGTILVSLVLIGIVTLIIVKMRKSKKEGRSACSGNCTHCAMGGGCHHS